MAAEVSAAKRDRDFFLSRVDKAKAVAAQDARKRKVRPSPFAVAATSLIGNRCVPPRGKSLTERAVLWLCGGSCTDASNLFEVAGSMLVSCAAQRPCMHGYPQLVQAVA